MARGAGLLLEVMALSAEILQTVSAGRGKMVIRPAGQGGLLARPALQVIRQGATPVSGGNGGSGGSGTSGGSGGGGGGGGGAGAFLTDIGSATDTAIITGGPGGNGGNLTGGAGAGGGGGGGGVGMTLRSLNTASTLTVDARITGGAGGTAGSGSTYASGGGGGGAGVVLDTSGATVGSSTPIITLNNDNTIMGGMGGNGAAGTGSGPGGGGAGVAMVGSGITLQNSAGGIVSGGMGGATTRAAYGANGGSGVWVNGNGDSIVNAGRIVGGNGGNGGVSGSANLGGAGINANNSTTTIINTGSIAGGDGANSGASTGGAGINASSNISVTNSGNINGGTGSGSGAGGAGIVSGSGSLLTNTAGSTINGGNAGGTGSGGIGVNAVASTITNSGGIFGGNGSGAGVGGAGINGSNLTVVNSDEISGGLSGNGSTRAYATHFTGGVNTLTLQGMGWTLLGNIEIDNGSATFNQQTDQMLSSVIAGNGSIIQNGTGTLTLTGANTYSGDTMISAGILQVSADNNLGAASGSLSFDGGTLATTTSFATARNTALNTGGGTIDVAPATTFTMNGIISDGDGPGALTKTDAGTLVLTGANTYTGGTTVSGGILQVSADNNLGAAASGSLSFDGGTLATTASFATARNTAFNTGGGTIDVVSGTTLTMAGVLADGNGPGALTKTDTGTLVLTGANTYTGGTTISAGTLQLGDGTINGSITGDVTDNSALAFDPAAGTTLTQPGAISGTGAVEQMGAGTTVLTGANTYTGGTTISAGTLQLGDGTTNGSITGDVMDNSALALDPAAGSILTQAGVVSGAGMAQQMGAGTTVLTGANTYTGGTTIAAGTLQLGNGGSTGSVQGAIDVQASGTLAINRNGAVTLANPLTGTGLVTTDTNGQGFDFAASAGSVFAGTVAVGNSTFSLSGTNTTALTNATLRTDAGSVTTVGDGNQTIGGLTLNGGKMIFDATAPDQIVATSLITTGTLDASGTGTVQINVPQPYVPDALAIPGTANLLEQDDGDIGVQLVNATTTTGSGGGLTLVDQNGQSLSAGQQVNIAQGGNAVAVGTYNYRLTTAPDNGLYVNYGLTQLDLQAGQTLTLAEDPGATGAAADMSAQITGSGSLAINAGTGTVSLSNSTNTYAGETTVTSGALQLDANNALGQTSELSIANAATADLNGTTQTIGALEGQSGSTLDVNGGTLNITNGGASQGMLTGAGQLDVQGGTLDVQGANSTLGASIAIGSGATLQVEDVGGPGSGDIADAGTLALNGASGNLTNAISGAGTVSLGNGANASATGDNSGFGGTFDVASGTTLTAQAQQNLGTANIADAGTVALDAYNGTLGNAISGTGTVSLGNGANVSVTGDNSGFGGTFEVASGTTLTARAQQNLGTANIADAGTVALDAYNGTLGNAISGTGTVSLGNSANVSVMGDNSGFGGTFDVASGTTLTAQAQQNLGTASVADNGTLVVNAATDWTLGNAVSGTGDLVKEGTGTLSAGGSMTYTGTTSVNEGGLVVGTTDAPDVTLGGSGAGTVTIASGATLAGLGTVNGQVVNNGTVSALNVLPGQGAAAAGAFTLAGGLVNNGTVNLAGSSVGNSLVVSGNYVGNNGTIVLNTVMGNDSSPTDRLVLNGGQASGSTSLVIKQAGGNGAQTAQGIDVVQTLNGATTTPGAFTLSPVSDGYRQGVGTIVAGAYDYSLVRGGNGGAANDWYLASVGNQCADNATLCQTVQNTGASTQQAQPLLRPEVGSYLDNKLAASTMQFHELHDRQSQAPGAVGKDLNASSDANAWVRMTGTMDSRDSAGTLSGNETQYQVQAGSDIVRLSDGGEGSVRFGAMGSYGSDRNSTSNGLLSSNGTVDGYNVGLYGTWYGHRDILSGPYVDSWVMYGGYNNQVSGQGLPSESYHSNNLAASLEAGYSFPILQSDNRQLYIEPEVQVIYSDYRAANHTESNGTVVSGLSQSSVTTRLGVRLHGQATDDMGVKHLQPFAELNWWHGPASQTATFDGTTVSDPLPANRFEVKVGLQGNVTRNLSVWGSVAAQAGSQNYFGGTAQVGMKYSW